MNQSRLYLIAPRAEAFRVGDILDPLFEEQGLPTVLFEDAGNSADWCWSVYVEDSEENEARELIETTLNAAGIAIPLLIERLGDVDWVKETLRELAPVSAGRFYVHGSHDRQKARNTCLPIEIDAGLAFGTGHHGTTAGCLDMLEVCLKRRKPARAMDIGTGSGVLAIALAKAARIPVLATDIDPVAVQVAQQNSRNNGTAAFTKMVTAAGFNNPAFAAFGKADLILANILARPLEKLANSMSRHMAPGAKIILSGLLPHQRARIVSAYHQQGLVLERWHIRDDWLTLLMRKP